ncbi:MAG: hypothetical protein IPN71_14990 [Fibrobacteres bacterium]|nr:hypothetical protein [Fibrobacterota bacterium]
MSYLERTILRHHPELYFVIAAAILGGKIFSIPPTNYTPWPLIVVIVILSCVFGVRGIRAKAQQ